MVKEAPLQQSKIVLYTTPNGDVKLEVFLQDETMWLTQEMIAELFGVEVHTIDYYLKEIFKSGELEENSVIRKIRITASDRKQKRETCFGWEKPLLELSSGKP